MNITYLDKPSYLPASAVQRLEAFGTVTVYNDFPNEQETINRLNNADIAIVEWTELSREILESLTRVKCIVLVTTAFDFVDTEAAASKGIYVCNTPEYSRQSVAEYVFAASLELSKHLHDADRLVRTDPDRAKYTDHRLGFELFNKTLGVWGLGSIGSWVARIGNGFGMQVIGTSRAKKSLENVQDVTLDELLKHSDILAVCVSVNSDSEGVLSKARLQSMKRGSILISVTDNKVLDEEALTALLLDGHIVGAALDGKVHANSKLLQAPNILLTPGIAWYTQDALDRNVKMFVETVEAFLKGQPRFVVNGLI